MVEKVETLQVLVTTKAACRVLTADHAGWCSRETATRDRLRIELERAQSRAARILENKESLGYAGKEPGEKVWSLGCKWGS